jgi:hypothetical protein
VRHWRPVVAVARDLEADDCRWLDLGGPRRWLKIRRLVATSSSTSEAHGGSSSKPSDAEMRRHDRGRGDATGRVGEADELTV